MNPHETLAHEQYFNYNFCEKYICGTVHSIQRYSHIDRKLKSGKVNGGMVESVRTKLPTTVQTQILQQLRQRGWLDLHAPREIRVHFVGLP